MRKFNTILMATTILVSATLPLMAKTVSADQTKAPTTVAVDKVLDVIPTPDFIDKFDQSIELSGNKFVIDTNKLPNDTTPEELTQLKELILQKNSIIADSENLNDGTRIEKDVNSVTIVSDSGNSGQSNLLRFREGSNYVHVYWWGLRIGLSKTTVNFIGAGVAIGGIWVPEPVVSKVLATIGVVATFCPGGIVFNSTPPIMNAWGLEFQ